MLTRRPTAGSHNRQARRRGDAPLPRRLLPRPQLPRPPKVDPWLHAAAPPRPRRDGRDGYRVLVPEPLLVMPARRRQVAPHREGPLPRQGVGVERLRARGAQEGGGADARRPRRHGRAGGEAGPEHGRAERRAGRAVGGAAGGALDQAVGEEEGQRLDAGRHGRRRALRRRRGRGARWLAPDGHRPARRRAERPPRPPPDGPEGQPRREAEAAAAHQRQRPLQDPPGVGPPPVDRRRDVPGRGARRPLRGGPPDAGLRDEDPRRREAGLGGAERGPGKRRHGAGCAICEFGSSYLRLLLSRLGSQLLRRSI